MIDDYVVVYNKSNNNNNNNRHGMNNNNSNESHHASIGHDTFERRRSVSITSAIASNSNALVQDLNLPQYEAMPVPTQIENYKKMEKNFSRTGLVSTPSKPTHQQHQLTDQLSSPLVSSSQTDDDNSQTLNTTNNEFSLSGFSLPSPKLMKTCLRLNNNNNDNTSSQSIGVKSRSYDSPIGENYPNSLKFAVDMQSQFQNDSIQARDRHDSVPVDELEEETILDVNYYY
jgi:hypothetical protein